MLKQFELVRLAWLRLNEGRLGNFIQGDAHIYSPLSPRFITDEGTANTCHLVLFLFCLFCFRLIRARLDELDCAGLNSNKAVNDESIVYSKLFK